MHDVLKTPPRSALFPVSLSLMLVWFRSLVHFTDVVFMVFSIGTVMYVFSFDATESPPPDTSLVT